jgi:hypothetical protein
MGKNARPSEPKDEGWFENPEHQKGVAIAAAGFGTELLGLALIVSAPCACSFLTFVSAASMDMRSGPSSTGRKTP